MPFARSFAVFVMLKLNNWYQILVFLSKNGKFSMGLLTANTTHPRYMLEHIQGGVVIGESLLKVY